jgi:hypothetical protein
MSMDTTQSSTSAVAPGVTPQPAPSRTSTREATSLSLVPLAIAAGLAVVLHVASGIMLDRSHAGPAGAALDAAIAGVAESPPQPSVPYD